MSLLPQATNANATTAYFLRANAQLINVSTLNAGSISTASITTSSLLGQFLSTIECDAEYMNTSTINTLHLDLDGQILTATPTELLLNGIPIATQSSLSSIADWSLDPAISTVQMAGNDLDAAGTISSLNVRSGNGFFQNLIAFNSLFVSTATSTISTSIEFADLGNFSTLNAGTISSGVGTISSLAGDSAQFSTISCDSLSTILGSISSLKTDEIFVSSLTTDHISTNAIAVSSINGAEFTSTGITVQVAGVSSLVANSISSVGAEIRQALMSTIVFSPSLNPSLGGVNVNLGLGGILGNVIGWGAGVFGAATGTVGLITGMTALASGRQADYIDNSRYELVNGTTQLQFSTLGTTYSTIYRLNSSADPQRIPGEEILISTINPPGVAVRSVSDPLYTLSTPNSTIQAFGEWVPVPDELVNVSTFATASISAATISSVNGLNLNSLENISTFNNLNASSIATSSISTAIIYGANSNLFGLGIQGLEIQTAPTGQVWISSPQTNIAGLTNTSTLGAVNLQARNGGISSLQVSSLSFAQAGAFGLSSLMWLSTSQIPGTGTSTTTYLNTDLSLLQNDLYVQQLRVGYANTGGSALSEIIMYAPTVGGTSISLNVGNSDRTARIQSTQNAGFGGYILDTSLNPPFFSTINNTSTAMIAYFPSTTANTIGYSTLSIIPVSFQTTSAFSGTLLYPNISSSAVAANIVASTTIQTNAGGSYVIAQANTSFLNTTNQYHDIYLNLAIDGVVSPSTFTSLPAGINHYANGSIAFRQAVSSGTHTLVLYASADANGAAVGSQVDIWGTGNLAP